MVTIGAIPHDITPLLMSLLLSVGPNISTAHGVDDLRVVIQDVTNMSRVAVSVGEMAVFFNMFSLMAQCTLDDKVAVMSGVPFLLTPSISVAFITQVNLPSVGKVINPGIEDCTGKPRHHRGVIKHL
jgi:hypothetical protein